jgi:hypothetical protein
MGGRIARCGWAAEEPVSLRTRAIIPEVTRRVRLAVILWLAFAVVVWNIVFDRMLVIEGREYVHAAATAVSTSEPYVLAGPWMRAANSRALVIATAAASVVLTIGFIGIAVAARRPEPGATCR